MKNKTIPAFLTVLLAVSSNPGYCQETAPDIISRAKKLLEAKDTSQSAGIDPAEGIKLPDSQQDAGQILSTLKNPFISQLPEPETVKNIVPQQPVPAPRMEPANLRVEPPAQTAVPENVPRPNFRINGLVWNTDRPRAIVDHKIVGVGDSINQWKIIDIKKEGIKIIYQDQTYLIEP